MVPSLNDAFDCYVVAVLRGLISVGFTPLFVQAVKIASRALFYLPTTVRPNIVKVFTRLGSGVRLLAVCDVLRESSEGAAI